MTSNDHRPTPSTLEMTWKFSKMSCKTSFLRVYSVADFVKHNRKSKKSLRRNPSAGRRQRKSAFRRRRRNGGRKRSHLSSLSRRKPSRRTRRLWVENEQQPKWTTASLSLGCSSAFSKQLRCHRRENLRVIFVDAAADDIKFLFFCPLLCCFRKSRMEKCRWDEFSLNERHAAVQPVIKKKGAAAGAFWCLLLLACPSWNEIKKYYFFFREVFEKKNEWDKVFQDLSGETERCLR